MCEKSKPSDTPDMSTGELPEQSEKEVHVPYWETPPPPYPGKEIHDRAYIPLVPEGEDIIDDTPSPPVDLE